MVFIHLKKILINKKYILDQVKSQNRQRKIYSGRIRLWIETGPKAEFSFSSASRLIRILSTSVYKSPDQIHEVLIRRIPGKSGMSVFVQDLDQYQFTHAGYDRLDQYIVIPPIQVIQAVEEMNNKERNNYRKRVKRTIPLTATAVIALMGENTAGKLQNTFYDSYGLGDL